MSDDITTRLIRARPNDPEVAEELGRLRDIILAVAHTIATGTISERATIDEGFMFPGAVHNTMERLAKQVRDAEAERDRLRAVVNAVHRSLYRGIDPGDLDDEQMVFLPSIVGGVIDGQGGALDEAVAERDRLREVLEVVRVIWDNLTSPDEAGTFMQFPTVPHYDALEQALDKLDAEEGT